MAAKDTKISVRTSSGQVIINFNGCCCCAKCGQTASCLEVNVCKCSPCKCTPVCKCSSACKGASGSQQQIKEDILNACKDLTVSQKQCADSSVRQSKSKEPSVSQQKRMESALNTAIERVQKKEKKSKKEKERERNYELRPPSPQPLSLGPLLCGDPEEQVSSFSTRSSDSQASAKKPKASKTSKTPKKSESSKKTSPKEAKANGGYFLHQKHVVLNASIDGIPISTNLAINIKSKNKDARVVLKEMWVDGERLYSQRKNVKKN